MFNALIQPHFDYACSAWYPNLNKKFKSKLQTVQNRCIRYCLQLDNRGNVGMKNFEKINWLSVSEIFNQYLCSNAFNFLKESSRHGCISDASLRHLMQRLRDISKRVDLQISETSPVRCIIDASSETSLRSLRSSQRCLWVSSEIVIRYFQTEAFFGYILIYLRVFKYFANLI